MTELSVNGTMLVKRTPKMSKQWKGTCVHVRLPSASHPLGSGDMW